MESAVTEIAVMKHTAMESTAMDSAVMESAVLNLFFSRLYEHLSYINYYNNKSNSYPVRRTGTQLVPGNKLKQLTSSASVSSQNDVSC